MATIPDKRSFVALQRRGLLGNYLRSWDSTEQAGLDGYSGWVTVRGRKPSFTRFIPEIRLSAVKQSLRDVNQSEYYVQEIPPPGSGRLVNFEACWLAPHGITLLYGALGTDQNLRHDLQQNGVEVTGARAHAMLREWTMGDHDVLLDIWDQYPSAVIEASVFNRAVGEFKRSMVIWEVRDF